MRNLLTALASGVLVVTLAGPTWAATARLQPMEVVSHVERHHLGDGDFRHRCEGHGWYGDGNFRDRDFRDRYR